MSADPITAIVLTFNSERSIQAVIEACKVVANRIIVVDSGSTDGTIEIVSKFGCEIASHPFENYSQQRNWAQLYAQLDPSSWVLHVDSDEVISAKLADSILRAVVAPPSDVKGFLMRRVSFFWGKPIRHGHMNPSWHLRLYRAGSGQCEERLYDQHFVLTSGVQKRLDGVLDDLQLVSLESWTASHNRWSTAEALEIISRRAEDAGTKVVLQGSLAGDVRMRKRWLKNNVWYRMPLLLKPFLFFTYSYFFKLGFLDGVPGLVYHVLQAFWFRFLIDAKVIELTADRKAKAVVN